MENLRKFLFFALLASTATFSSGSKTPTTKYDITTLLNDSIARTFQYMNSEFIEELFFSIEDFNSTTFEKKTEYEIAPFENKFYFTVHNITPLNVLHSPFTKVRRSFPFDVSILYSEKLVIKIDADLGATNDTVHVHFSRFVDFEDCSILISRIMVVERLFDVHLIYDNYTSYDANSPWFHPDIESDSRLKLERQIDKLLPRILQDSLLKNERFCHFLQSAFLTHPEEKINSTYTDFANNKHQYHYFIPKFTSLRRTLSNITLTGLSNFENHAFRTNLGRPISTLVISNIAGKANLYFGSPNSTIFPLQFNISCLTIELDREKGFVDVRTDDYLVNETKSNQSLNEYQSKWIMEGIQLAIASSIMPSIKVYRPRNQSTNTNGEHPITKILTTMSHLFREDVVRKLNATWNTSVLNMTRIESNLEIESAQYNISINMSEAALVSFLHLEWISCYPYKYLEVSFETNTNRNSHHDGKIMLRNTTHVFDDIDFVVTSLRIYVSKCNSNENDDYESKTAFFWVKLLAKRSSIDKSQLTMIQDKAEKMLASSIEKILLPYTKSLLSSTLNYCTTPVKMFDDFLPFYANYELPYIVPDIDNVTNTEEEDLFASMIHNVVISKWQQFSHVDALFPPGHDKLEPTVIFQLKKVNITLNVNDTSSKLELEVTNQELCFQNGTDDDGKISAQFWYWEPPFRVPATNKFFSERENLWLKDKVQYFIEKSFE